MYLVENGVMKTPLKVHKTEHKPDTYCFCYYLKKVNLLFYL